MDGLGGPVVVLHGVRRASRIPEPFASAEMRLAERFNELLASSSADGQLPVDGIDARVKLLNFWLWNHIRGHYGSISELSRELGYRDHSFVNRMIYGLE